MRCEDNRETCRNSHCLVLKQDKRNIHKYHRYISVCIRTTLVLVCRVVLANENIFTVFEAIRWERMFRLTFDTQNPFHDINTANNKERESEVDKAPSNTPRTLQKGITMSLNILAPG